MSLLLSRADLEQLTGCKPGVCWLFETQPSVYVLSAGSIKTPDKYFACKIGMSGNPWARAVHQRSLMGVHNICKVELVMPCNAAARVEAKAHELMSERLIEREWFDCSIEEAEQAVFEAFRQVGR